MTPTFTVDCINTEAKGLMGRPLAYIKQAMTAKPSGYQHMPAYKKGYWDGNICLFKDGSFPSGLLFLAAQELQEAKVDYEIIDLQPKVDITPDFNLGDYELRPYQIESIQAALDYRRGILKLATNAGKTLVTAGIIKSTGCNAVVVVPTKPLLYQTSDYYTKVLHEKVGKVGDGYLELDAPVVVTTMASFYKVAGCIRSFNTLIIDECHHGKAKSIAEAAQFIEAPIRIGVSGTPLAYSDLDDLTLMGMTGPLLYEETNAELIQAGYSVKPVIVFHEITEPEVSKKTKYPQAYQQCIVDNVFRNFVIKEIVEDNPGLSLVLVERLEHVVNLLEIIPGAVSATGADDTVKILDGMRRSEYNCVIATNVFSEGIDVEGIDSIILAGAGTSHIRLLQRIGRGLRVSPGKDKVVIHDFIDSGSRHLIEQSGERLTVYEREGFEVRLDDP